MHTQQHKSLVLQVQGLGLNNNLLNGGLPQSWSNLTSVSLNIDTT